MSEDKALIDETEEELMEQDHKRGPGWFLLLSYLVIVSFCFYYLFTFWDWKSDYEIQQEELKAKKTQQME